MSSATARMRSRLGFGIDSDWRESRSRIASSKFMDVGSSLSCSAQLLELGRQRGSLLPQRRQLGSLLVDDLCRSPLDKPLAGKLRLAPRDIGSEIRDPLGKTLP